MSKGNVLLCAGGTGGHLFPAEAVAHEMVRRGYTVHLAADDRVKKYADRFPAEAVHQISSATLGSKNPMAIAKTMYLLFSGYRQSQKLIKEISPVVTAGFGGYPTVPPVFASTRLGIPTMVHEANAVLGRANRLLAKYVNQIAIGFGETTHLGEMQVTVTGNPVRPDIVEASEIPYGERTEPSPFNLLVFGGSQGASFFSECLPAAFGLLEPDLRSRVRVTQQAREEDLDEVVRQYKDLSMEAEVRVFFSGMAELISSAHLVVSRAGASTVSELSVIGRPSILVPYPHALDHDQATNAATVAKCGGATIFAQSDLTPEKLAEELTSAIQNPKRLSLAAENAKAAGKPQATAEIADMLEGLAASKK